MTQSGDTVDRRLCPVGAVVYSVDSALCWFRLCWFRLLISPVDFAIRLKLISYDPLYMSMVAENLKMRSATGQLQAMNDLLIWSGSASSINLQAMNDLLNPFWGFGHLRHVKWVRSNTFCDTVLLIGFDILAIGGFNRGCFTCVFERVLRFRPP